MLFKVFFLVFSVFLPSISYGADVSFRTLQRKLQENPKDIQVQTQFYSRVIRTFNLKNELLKRLNALVAGQTDRTSTLITELEALGVTVVLSSAISTEQPSFKLLIDVTKAKPLADYVLDALANGNVENFFCKKWRGRIQTIAFQNKPQSYLVGLTFAHFTEQVERGGLTLVSNYSPPGNYLTIQPYDLPYFQGVNGIAYLKTGDEDKFIDLILIALKSNLDAQFCQSHLKSYSRFAG